MKWEFSKIGDNCEVTSSKRIFYSEYVKSGIPFYRSKEVIQSFLGQSIDEHLYISEEKYKQIADKFGVPEAGDMLLTSVGTIGVPYLIKESDCFYFKDGNLTWFKNFSKNLSSKYLYYWIQSPQGKGVLFNSTIGSSQKALTISMLKGISIPLPPIGIQNRITDILSSYDDLIENNQKQIKLLEEAAMRLYKEWFVNLRFPGHENTKIVDGLPEGWSRKKLIDIAEITMGQSPKSEYYNDKQQGLPFHQGVTNYGYRFVIDEKYSTSYTRIAEAGSILFSVRAPVGRMNITKNKIVIGRGLAAINHREGLQSFLFYMLKNRFYKDDLIGNGAIYASITKSALHSQEFLIPSDNLANKFNSVAKSIDQQITNADRQIILLKQARDKLLPKLMNGDIEV
jgi:type I restriction enzyme S subunit